MKLFPGNRRHGEINSGNSAYYILTTGMLKILLANPVIKKEKKMKKYFHFA